MSHRRRESATGNMKVQQTSPTKRAVPVAGVGPRGVLRALTYKLAGGKSKELSADTVTPKVTLLKRETNATALSRLRRRINKEIKQLTHSNQTQNKLDAEEESKSAKEEPQTTNAKTCWNYDLADKVGGPSTWPMADGVRQSPIDLSLRDCSIINLDEDSLSFHNYCTLVAGHMLNNGHSVQFLPDDTPVGDLPEISGGRLNQTYRFIQYHYHWSQDSQRGSEHSVDGRFYAAELHLVHQGVDDPTKLAVLGVFLQESDEHPETEGAFDVEQAVLDQVREYGERIDAPVQRLIDKLPQRQAFARYDGSLTTPPCTENVTWTVFTDPIIVSPEMMAKIRLVKGSDGACIGSNCRPQCKLYDRSVFCTRG